MFMPISLWSEIGITRYLYRKTVMHEVKKTHHAATEEEHADDMRDLLA